MKNVYITRSFKHSLNLNNEKNNDLRCSNYDLYDLGRKVLINSVLVWNQVILEDFVLVLL